MFVKPEEVVNKLGLGEGMTVADIGAGSGAYTLLLAGRVGSSGKVYAIDVQKDLLARLKSEAIARHLLNVEIIWGNVERNGDSKLADGAVDFVFISNLLFQTTARYSVLQEAKRILKPNGRLTIIDWEDSFGNLGPTPDQVLKKTELLKILTEAGLRVEKEFSAGDHHYGILVSKISTP